MRPNAKAANHADLARGVCRPELVAAAVKSSDGLIRHQTIEGASHSARLLGRGR